MVQVSGFPQLRTSPRWRPAFFHHSAQASRNFFRAALPWPIGVTQGRFAGQAVEHILDRGQQVPRCYIQHADERRNRLALAEGNKGESDVEAHTSIGIVQEFADRRKVRLRCYAAQCDAGSSTAHRLLVLQSLDNGGGGLPVPQRYHHQRILQFFPDMLIADSGEICEQRRGSSVRLLLCDAARATTAIG